MVINGISGNVKSAAFNPVTFTWRTMADPPVDNAANGSSQAVFVDGKVLLFSVLEDGATAHDQVASLDDPQSGQWTIVAAPPVSLGSGVGVVAAGSAAIVVGQSNSTNGCNLLHILAYSPSANSWRELAAGPVANRAAPVTAWTGTSIATVTPDGSPLLYNPTTDTWHLGPKIN